MGPAATVWESQLQMGNRVPRGLDPFTTGMDRALENVLAGGWTV